MKLTLKGLRDSKTTRWACLGAVLLGASTSLGWMNQRQYQLGGGWIGADGAGHVWNAFQIPLDPAGRTMALRVNNMATGPANAALFNAFGADTGSDAVGQGVMINRDTCKWSMIAYAQSSGNPIQNQAIFRYTGLLTFTDADAWVINYTLEAFLPSADADLDGFPDAGALPVLTLPNLTASAKRVPLP